MSGQPNKTTICLASANTVTVSTAPIVASKTNALLNILLASSLSPSPSFIPARGEPPNPTKLANAVSISVTGNTMPSAASASMPCSGICATYMRSTMLYKKVISCATTAGIVSRSTSGSILPCSSRNVGSAGFFCLFNVFLRMIGCVVSVSLS